MSKVYTSLGLMSGTSLDGVDAAIIKTDGERILEVGESLTLYYKSWQRQTLQDATEAALRWNFEGPPPNIFAEAEEVLDSVHREAARALSVEGVDVVGYHGQTVLHRPDKLKTLQLGQGQRIATVANCPVVYDFRSADVAAGGQGAPLAPIYHKALVEDAKLTGVTAVLNLGGVGNLTIIDGDRLLASDTGPANGPLDSLMATQGELMDIGGQISRQGLPDFARIDEWLAAPFFKRSWPKSADRYDFDVVSDLADMTLVDSAATLCAFTALSVAETIEQMVCQPERVIVCGGGRRNPTLMTMLMLELGCPVFPAEAAGWQSDAIEAQAFAYLAVRVMRNLPNSFPTTTGVSKPIVGGRVAQPF